MRYSIVITCMATAVQASNFWRLPCKSRTAAARMDPIMAPGEPNSHLHTIFGSGGFSSNVTQDDLLHSDCTSCAVTQDRSAYWTPPLMFLYPNGSSTMVNQDGGMLAYYFVYGNNPQPFPQGFRMVAGDQYLRNFTGPVPDLPTSEWTANDKTQFSLAQKALGFNCLHYDRGSDEDSLYRHTLPDKQFLDENCSDGLRLELMFPSCWNGVDVDTPNHKSHMAYPDLVKDGKCPEGFGTRLVTLFFETKYDTQNFKGVDGQFVLATGDPTGCGYHGDFIQGWESDFLRQAMDECSNPSGEVADCQLFTLQSDQDASACQAPVPKELGHENPFFNGHGLLGDVPIQEGPERAAPYGAQSSMLMDHLPVSLPVPVPVPSIGVVGEVARVVDNLVPTATPTHSHSLSPSPSPRRVESVAKKCSTDKVTVYETAIVHVPMATHSPASASTPTLRKHGHRHRDHDHI
ncbi:hypothetical protein EYB25_004812 [Talaromyces marneffei]|uniref:DUF1996 domain-containing protein n=1 Tax=Talaromyces marneffei (strain ATCC 18224 / CBS 334.59 / QM 7333) TaxID=441960 RepID=B6QF29_TALMQ|nr:uncharacterized protein EYB26_004122 [Talaromyces marneffei]EEA24064.1 conserved hypothetical protein [Talaromyces marneffei ATCC 18224]KAE8553430.1 hypothetical protein EYB25_004812 [Talaromyces marneffei]QGA16455.1 hypothetical protein EYB26_004122 [Talaromyces marneffei]